MRAALRPIFGHRPKISQRKFYRYGTLNQYALYVGFAVKIRLPTIHENSKLSFDNKRPYTPRSEVRQDVFDDDCHRGFCKNEKNIERWAFLGIEDEIVFKESKLSIFFRTVGQKISHASSGLSNLAVRVGVASFESVFSWKKVPPTEGNVEAKKAFYRALLSLAAMTSGFVLTASIGIAAGAPLFGVAALLVAMAAIRAARYDSC